MAPLRPQRGPWNRPRAYLGTGPAVVVGSRERVPAPTYLTLTHILTPISHHRRGDASGHETISGPCRATHAAANLWLHIAGL